MKNNLAFILVCSCLCGCDCAHECAGDHHNSHEKVLECAGKNNNNEKAHTHKSCNKEHKDHYSNKKRVVTVPLAIQRSMALETVKVEKRDISSRVSLPGRYELMPNAREIAATPVAGHLRIIVQPLAKVKKGDVLFTVSSPDLVVRENEISVLEKRLEVYRKIKTRNAALENELAVKRAERAALVGGFEEKGGVITVRAQSDALVDNFAAKTGEWLEIGGKVLEIVRPQSLRFKALAAASDAEKLKEGMAAKVGKFSGEVRLGVGDGTGLVPVYVNFRDEIGAIAGARAEAEVFLGGGGKAKSVVPSKAVVLVGLQPTVFIKDSKKEGCFIAIDVIPGEQSGPWTAVEGLPSGEVEVVTKGAYELKIALNYGEKPNAGHFHADGTFQEGEH